MDSSKCRVCGGPCEKYLQECSEGLLRYQQGWWACEGQKGVEMTPKGWQQVLLPPVPKGSGVTGFAPCSSSSSTVLTSAIPTQFSMTFDPRSVRAKCLTRRWRTSSPRAMQWTTTRFLLLPHMSAPLSHQDPCRRLLGTLLCRCFLRWEGTGVFWAVFCHSQYDVEVVWVDLFSLLLW